MLVDGSGKARLLGRQIPSFRLPRFFGREIGVLVHQGTKVLFVVFIGLKVLQGMM